MINPDALPMKAEARALITGHIPQVTDLISAGSAISSRTCLALKQAPRGTV